MGQKNSKTVLQSYDFDLGEYQMLRQSKDFNTWKNTEDPFTYPQIQQYRAVIQTDEELRYEREVFDFRRNVLNVVNALQMRSVKTDEMCAQFYSRSLFIEKIYLRLTDLTQIPLADSIYMMIASLTGFKKLYDRFGFFRVTQQMIGINVHCMVKMWMSENYGCSKPDFPAGSARGEGTEKDMASMIVRLIWNNTAKQASQSLAESPYEFMMSAFHAHPRKNQYGLKQASYSIFEYAVKYGIKYSLDMSSAAHIVNQLKLDAKSTIAMKEKSASKVKSQKQSTLHTSKSVDTKTFRKYSFINANDNPKIDNGPKVPLGPQKTQRITPPKINIKSQCSINSSSNIARQPIRIPSRIPGGELPRVPSPCNSTSRLLSFRSPTSRPRIIFNQKTDYCGSPSKPEIRFQTSLCQVLKDNINFMPSTSEYLPKIYPIDSAHNIGNEVRQSQGMMSNCADGYTIHKVVSPNKYKFFKEIPSSVLQPIQFSQKLSRKMDVLKTSRVLAPLNEFPKSCHVIDMDTIDSPIKKIQETDKPNSFLQSIESLLIKLDDSEYENNPRSK